MELLEFNRKFLEALKNNNVSIDISLDKTEKLGGGVVIRNVAPLQLTGSATALLTTSSSAVAEAGGETVDGVLFIGKGFYDANTRYRVGQYV